MRNTKTKINNDEIVAAIRLYYEKHGYSPSIREIGDMTGIRSTSTVHKHLEMLEKNGKVIKESNVSRTIRIVGE